MFALFKNQNLCSIHASVINEPRKVLLVEGVKLWNVDIPSLQRKNNKDNINYILNGNRSNKLQWEK